MGHVIIQNQAGTLRRAFRVLGLSNYRPREDKLTTERQTVTRKRDFQFGAVTKDWEYVLKVYGTATDTVSHSAGTLIAATSTPEGDFDDLRTFFRYTTPGENLLAILDVDGTEHQVYLTGSLQERQVTAQIGADAYYYVPIQMKRAEPIA